ncbi:MAG TPA: glycosyltransferase family 1 protein [Gammaproteobacteria bacterium]|nr:glycosyltransferase family 1 protein [Gammaproteobacteria bacterium]
MKILELCLSRGFGGLELYVDKVARHFASTAHDCLAVVYPDTLLDKRLREAGSVPHYLRVRNRHLPLLAARKLAKLIDANGIDVIHMHWGKDLPLAVLARRFARRPVRLIYTRQMAITRPKFDVFHRFLYRHVDSYVCITRKLQEDARGFLPMPAEDVRLLYYGVADPGPVDAETCRRFAAEAGFDEGVFRIGLFGRIEHGKGQHLLLEAVDTLNREGRDIKAVLIGHPMTQAYLDKLLQSARERGLEKHFSHYGFHDNPQSIMGCFDVVVLATYAETFGLVLIEAMRAGTAVVGTNAGGVPEIIRDGETGLLFEPGDAAGLAAALRRLQEDVAFREALAAQGKAFADTQFSEERHFVELEKILAGEKQG